MADKKNRKDVHFVDDRPYGDDSLYDPEEEIPDPDQVERDIEEAEEEYLPEKKKKKRPAA